MMFTGLQPSSANDTSNLVLQARLYSQQVVERLPLVIELRLQNRGTRAVECDIGLDRWALMADRSTVELRDASGDLLGLYYRGGLISALKVAKTELAPGEEVVVDRIVSPLALESSTATYRFVGPGEYTGHVKLQVGGAEEVISNEFSVQIVKAIGEDARVRDRIGVKQMSYLEGSHWPTDRVVNGEQKGYERRDAEMFAVLQEILDEHPETTYAQWIRFWKLYHQGPTDKAVRFAREHRDFPLSDNLLFRVAQRAASAGDLDKATELARTLEEDFSTSDSGAHVQLLHEKIAEKRGKR